MINIIDQIFRNNGFTLMKQPEPEKQIKDVSGKVALKKIYINKFDEMYFVVEGNLSKNTLDEILEICLESEKNVEINFFFSVKISIPLENTGVSSVFATSVWPFSLIFSLARRNEGNFFQAVPTTLSSSLAEVRLASLVAWA